MRTSENWHPKTAAYFHTEEYKYYSTWTIFSILLSYSKDNASRLHTHNMDNLTEFDLPGASQPAEPIWNSNISDILAQFDMPVASPYDITTDIIDPSLPKPSPEELMDFYTKWLPVVSKLDMNSINVRNLDWKDEDFYAGDRQATGMLRVSSFTFRYFLEVHVFL